MPKVLLLHHFYAPDDVAGAMQFSGLGEGLVARGFEVEVWPANRRCHPTSPVGLRRTGPPLSGGPRQTGTASVIGLGRTGSASSAGSSRVEVSDGFGTKVEILGGVMVRRVWRPGFPQHRFFGRIINAIWMMKFWGWRALFAQAPDVVILGTDPIFGLLLAPFLKWRWPSARIIHWVFDLYPEYPIAEGIISEKGIVARSLRWLMKWGYGKCDLVADLGACMRERLAAYSIRRFATLTPWSLEEPEKPLDFDPEEREALFGANSQVEGRVLSEAEQKGFAKLALLYSGNLSHPHEFTLTLKLARRMRTKAVFVYSARGSRMDDLNKALNPEDLNVRFASFAPLDKLKARLSVPDIHLVSLKRAYTGVAVPSKFFGALAVGRPVLFEGDPRSAIARWIEEYEVGWVLKRDNMEQVLEALEALAGDERKKKAFFKRCHQVYQKHFSRQAVVDRWAGELRSL
ncbi:MAG: glycosyltransferase family 4 protein [bacterium]